MATRTNTLAVLNESLGLWETLTSGDTIALSGMNLTVGGNLTVTGTTTTTHSEQVMIADQYLFLNAGYTTAAAQRGGLVLNRLPTATIDTVAATGFVAGVAAVSNPTVATTGSATFAASDIIQISGADLPGNNGLFEVLSHVGTLLTIRGIGLTATVEDFTDNQFTTDTTVAGAITKVNISVLRSNTGGTAFEVGFGAVTPITFSALASSGSTTLQTAYENGNTITTSAGEGNVVITGTEKLQITATVGLDVDTQADFDVTLFDVQMTGTNGFSIDGTAASNVSVTGGNLTLSTTTSGSWIASSAGVMDLDATGALSINSSGGSINIGDDAVAQAINIGTGAAARTITVGNSTGATAVQITAGTGGITATGPANDTENFKVTDGTTDGITFDTTTGAKSVDIGSFLDHEASGGITLTAGANLVPGNVVRINASGQAALADADTGTTTDAWAIGSSVGTVTSGNPAQIKNTSGTLVPVKFAAAPAGASNGSIVYVSATAGEGTLTAPSGGGNVIFILGILQGADGSTTTPNVLWQPQFSAKKA